MIKAILMTLTLAVILMLNWDKVPQPVKKLLGNAKDVSVDIVDKGTVVPSPVTEYFGDSVLPRLKKLGKKVVE